MHTHVKTTLKYDRFVAQHKAVEDVSMKMNVFRFELQYNIAIDYPLRWQSSCAVLQSVLYCVSVKKTKIRKATQNVEMRVVSGSQGSPKVIANITADITIRQSTYDFLFDFNRNYASILQLFRVITSYLSNVANFNVPHLHLAPSWGSPVPFSPL